MCNTKLSPDPFPSLGSSNCNLIIRLECESQLFIPLSLTTMIQTTSFSNDSNDNSTPNYEVDAAASYATSFTIASSLAESLHSSNLFPPVTAPFTDDFNFIKYISRGASGFVYKVQHKQTRAVYALKTMHKYAPQIHNLRREQSVMRLVSESPASRGFLDLVSSWSDTKYFYILMVRSIHYH